MAEKGRIYMQHTGELSPLGEGVGAIERELEEARARILSETQVGESWDRLAEELKEREAGLTEVRDYQLWESRIEGCFRQNQDIIDRVRNDAKDQTAFLKAKLAVPNEEGKHVVAEPIAEQIASLMSQLERKLDNHQMLNGMKLNRFQEKAKPRENNWMDYRAALAREKMLKPVKDALQKIQAEYNRSWKFYRKEEAAESTHLAEATKLEQATNAYNKMIDQLYKGSNYSADMDFSQFYAQLPDLRIPAELIGSKPKYDDKQAGAYTAEMPSTWTLPDHGYWEHDYMGTPGQTSVDDAKLIRKDLEVTVNDFYRQLEQVGVAEDQSADAEEEEALAA